MSKQRGSLNGASAQDVGGAIDDIQRERVRTATVQTADGSRLLLSVLATSTDAGESAARVVEQIFQIVSGSHADNLATALKRGLEIASQGLARQGVEMAASAVAWRRNTIFYASIGDNVVFRIAGQEAIRLTQPSNSRLGTADASRLQAGPEAGLALQRGDRVVVASVGLLAASPADRKPYVDPSTIPEHIKNLPPEDAAKHLVSIALGRDVGSNVTVAVLGEPKNARRWTSAALVVAGILGGMLVIIGVLAVLNPKEDKTTTDFGFAVLVRGGVLADTGEAAPMLVGTLDPIPAGASLTAQTDAALGLQSTYESGGEQPGATIYLAPGAVVQLSEIDPRASDGRSGPTRLALGQGSILISRPSGTWEYRIQFEANESILSGAGSGAMGVVSNNGGGHHLYCLIGICRFESAAGEEILLAVGEQILLRNTSGIIEENSIDPAVISQWDRMCGGCVQGNR